MRKRDKEPIYSQFEINVILFYGTMVMFLPIVLVITYVFEIDEIVNIDRFMFWVLLANFFLTALGTLVLALRKDHLRRKVKPAYVPEFVYLLFVAGFGLLGIVVLYDYLDGSRQYIANVLSILLALLVYVLIFLGRRFFKYDYMKKQ